ncbi:MAG: hypothetical protein IKX74_08040 [Erysipelotrichaceae bacterium]|nr:hypothetical protein [Erysipelotrichaceae bacterium]
MNTKMKSVCVGDNVIDYYVNSGKMFPGGNSLNVAVHLARLGCDSAYLGNIGDDDMAKVILRALRDNGVDCRHCQFIENGTTKHCNYEVIDGERTFINVELGDNWSGPMVLNEERLAYLNQADVVISNCNAKMPEEMKKISRLDAIYVYDFGEKEKYHADEYLSMVCDRLDLAMFSLPPADERTLVSFARKIMNSGCVNVLITMGTHGQYLINKKNVVHGEADRIDAVDTMGAGDAFLAAFICRLKELGWQKGEILEKDRVTEALKCAGRYAGENCLREGGFGEEV